MVKRNDIWKFNEEEWKIHIKDESLKEKVQEKFNIGKSGTIVITNPATTGSLAWAALQAQIYTPGGSTISFNLTANKIAILTYFVAATDKILVNYVGNFGSYPQP